MKNYKINKGTTERSSKCLPLSGFYGTAMLFVIASIVLSTCLIVLGTDSKVYWALCAPQAGFAAVVLVYLTHTK